MIIYADGDATASVIIAAAAAAQLHEEGKEKVKNCQFSIVFDETKQCCVLRIVVITMASTK